MIGGVLFEHGHRLIAGTVALFTFYQAYLYAKKEDRAWVRGIAFAAVVVVLAQASLGGLTVLLKLPPAVSVTHACLAQIFFTLVGCLALVTSPSWFQEPQPLEPEPESSISLPKLCLLVNALFFLQLVMGAVMRHKKAGLAIPDFPLAFGGIVPKEFDFGISIHFAHRLGAFTLVLAVAYLVTRIYRRQAHSLGLVALAGALAGLVAFQFMLGAFVIWTKGGRVLSPRSTWSWERSA